jgi:hypothetical protein
MSGAQFPIFINEEGCILVLELMGASGGVLPELPTAGDSKPDFMNAALTRRKPNHE